ncbi:MAG TPA: lactate racemase domain-containing protein [Anaerolineae bacterium]
MNTERALSEDQIEQITAEALGRLSLDGKRVLVIIPDGTRTAPIALFFRLLIKLLAGQVAALDFLIALGTHPRMSADAISQRLGLSPDELDHLPSRVHVLQHEWWKPETFFKAGSLSGDEVATLTDGMLNTVVDVTLNRRILEYDQLLICGPVYPHEVVGFSGGTKYLFPGISGQKMIDFTHWLGALHTSYAIIGRKDTVVRAVINRAAEFVARPTFALCLVVQGGALVGLYIGEARAAWGQAADHSARVHIQYLERPMHRVLAVMPAMYEDMWTGAKGMYKAEPIIADDGEIVIYAPHITQVSYTHGSLLDEIGYHVRDYFVKQWARFEHYPWGVLAHSTHLRGLGEYDAARGIETPRVRVTLATGISREHCTLLNLGYTDPAAIDFDDWRGRENEGVLLIPKAGEQLYRLKRN